MVILSEKSETKYMNKLRDTTFLSAMRKMIESSNMGKRGGGGVEYCFR